MAIAATTWLQCRKTPESLTGIETKWLNFLRVKQNGRKTPESLTGIETYYAEDHRIAQESRKTPESLTGIETTLFGLST